MKVGMLDFIPVSERLDLVAEPVAAALSGTNINTVYVTAIDPAFADTAAFCEQYNIGLDISANCVVLEAKRAERSWYVACIVLATTRVDVNGSVRRHIDARKVSFAPMNAAVTISEMESGGITPVGIPKEWPILVDTAVANTPWVIAGSGLRRSKLLIAGTALAMLPGAEVLSVTRQPEM